jgi:predicted DNA binding CopG/RHH family protein
MKNYLDKEEKETLKAVEDAILNGTAVSILTPERKAEWQAMARETIQKTKSINIRVSSNDLLKLKSKALENGMSYQTIVSTLIHQYNKGKLKIEL